MCYFYLSFLTCVKCVGVRTASLDEKSTACDLLVSYAEELGGDFFSYIDPVLKIMLPLLQFYYTEDITLLLFIIKLAFSLVV